MTEDQADLLRNARENLEASRLLLHSGYPAVISAFGKHLALTGRVPSEFHRYLIRSEELRNVSDYGPRGGLSREEGEEQVARAELFVELAERLIGPVPPEESDTDE